jgi:hypothetical protein
VDNPKTPIEQPTPLVISGDSTDILYQTFLHYIITGNEDYNSLMSYQYPGQVEGHTLRITSVYICSCIHAIHPDVYHSINSSLYTGDPHTACEQP